MDLSAIQPALDTEGATSPYYAGLNLVILVTCMLMPFTVADALAVCSITIGLYTAAIFGHDGLALPPREYDPPPPPSSPGSGSAHASGRSRATCSPRSARG